MAYKYLTRDEYLRAAKAIRDKAVAEGRDLTAAELDEIRALLDEAPEQGLNLGRLLEDDLPGHRPVPAGRPAAPGARTFASLFGHPAQESDGFSGWGDYLQAVARAPVYRDERLRLAGQVWGAIMQEGSDALGGFATPESLRAELLDGLLGESFMLQHATVLPVGAAKSVKIAMVEDDDHSSGILFGNITGQWVAEGSAPSFSNAELKQLTLTPAKLAILLQITNELLADSEALAQQLPTMLRQAATWFVERALLNGTGTGQPLGALNAPSVIAVSRQTSGTIKSQDVFSLVQRLHSALWSRSWWLTSPSALARLASLTIEVRNDSGSVVGGGYLPLLQLGNPPTILGRPVHVSEHVASLGDEGDLVLMAPSEYIVALRQEISVAVSGHFAFDKDISTFRVLLRLDGKARWTTTKTMANGDVTSWCVRLGPAGSGS